MRDVCHLFILFLAELPVYFTRFSTSDRWRNRICVSNSLPFLASSEKEISVCSKQAGCFLEGEIMLKRAMGERDPLMNMKEAMKEKGISPRFLRPTRLLRHWPGPETEGKRECKIYEDASPLDLMHTFSADRWATSLRLRLGSINTGSPDLVAEADAYVSRLFFHPEEKKSNVWWIVDRRTECTDWVPSCFHDWKEKLPHRHHNLSPFNDYSLPSSADHWPAALFSGRQRLSLRIEVTQSRSVNACLLLHSFSTKARRKYGMGVAWKRSLKGLILLKFFIVGNFGNLAPNAQPHLTEVAFKPKTSFTPIEVHALFKDCYLKRRFHSGLNHSSRTDL